MEDVKVLTESEVTFLQDINNKFSFLIDSIKKELKLIDNFRLFKNRVLFTDYLLNNKEIYFSSNNSTHHLFTHLEMSLEDQINKSNENIVKLNQQIKKEQDLILKQSNILKSMASFKREDNICIVIQKIVSENGK